MKPPSYRLWLFPVAVVLAALSPPRGAAQDKYYWNAPLGADWTANNAWQFGTTDGPAATWASGGWAVFDNTSAGVVRLPTSVNASHIDFAGTAGQTIAESPGTDSTLSLTGAGNVGTITMRTGAIAAINAPLGGSNITIARDAPASTGTTLQLGSANTFTGNLQLGGGGTLTTETNVVRLGSAGAIPTTATVRFLGQNAALVFHRGIPAEHAVPNGIELNVTNSTSGVSNSLRAGVLTRVTLGGTITGSGGLSFSAVADSAFSGVGSVFVLTGANTYSGNTTVNDGITLLVNNPVSGSGTGGVRGGGRIGGTGRIDGLDPQQTGLNIGLTFGGTGRLAPGDPAVNGGIGQLRVTRSALWVANGTYEFQIGGLTDTDADRDQLLCGDQLWLDTANATIKLDVSKVGSFAFTPGQTHTYRIAQANNGIAMRAGPLDLSRIEITSSFANPSDFTLSYEDGAGAANYLVLSYIAPVPEPGFVLLSCGFAMLVIRKWRG